MKIAFEILQYIGPFFGVFIGWLLSQRSEKRKVQYEEKKKVNHTLFLLLEIRTELTNILRHDKFLRIYIDKVKEKLDVEEPTEEESVLLKMLMSNLRISSKNENKENDIESQFITCVTNLSEINPILAFKINGKQDVKVFLENWENQFKEVVSFEDLQQTEKMLEHFKPKVINEFETDLNEIILSVAELTEDNQIIKNTTNLIQPQSDGEYEKDIAKLVDKLFDDDGKKTISKNYSFKR